MRESSIENKLRRYVRKLGGRAIKLQRTGRRGDVDRIVVLRNGTVVWTELKRPGKKPRLDQKRVHTWLRKRGHKVLICDGTNWPQVFNYLRECSKI